jgi:hypothetical protein
MMKVKDLVLYKYRNFNIGSIKNAFGTFEGHEIQTTGNINPGAKMPKVVLDAFKAYDYPNFCITYNELLEVCQEETDSSKKVPQSYLQ